MVNHEGRGGVRVSRNVMRNLGLGLGLGLEMNLWLGLGVGLPAQIRVNGEIVEET